MKSLRTVVTGLGGNGVIFWIPAIGLLLVLIYFLYLGRRGYEGKSFRQRYRERRRNRSPEEPINPDFQFENLTVDSAPKRPGGPQ